MLSIIFPYRERDVERIRFSLNSLVKQTNKEFQVYFVDYGSSITHANRVQKILDNYSFVKYTYYYTEYQPWNKSKALNSVIKTIDTEYFFVADIDMIFHPSFIETTEKLSKTKEVWYFKVGFLSKIESLKEKEFSDYRIKFESNNGATGLTLCPTEQAKSIRGFDELYHFWGSEDTDFHVRLINSGNKVNYYTKSILLLHKWHKTYRNKESDELTTSLQVKEIVQFNQLHLENALDNKTTKVNPNGWGEIMNEKDFFELNSKINVQTIINESSRVNYFLFQKLVNLQPGVYHFQFKEIDKTIQLKKQFKKVFKPKKKHKDFFTLKEVNDKILYQIVNFYHHYSYTYLIEKDLMSIYLSIKIN